MVRSGFDTRGRTHMSTVVRVRLRFHVFVRQGWL